MSLAALFNLQKIAVRKASVEKDSRRPTLHLLTGRPVDLVPWLTRTGNPRRTSPSATATLPCGMHVSVALLMGLEGGRHGHTPELEWKSGSEVPDVGTCRRQMAHTTFRGQIGFVVPQFALREIDGLEDVESRFALRSFDVIAVCARSSSSRRCAGANHSSTRGDGHMVSCRG